MPPIVRNGRFWLACFIAWFGVLLIMSSLPGGTIEGPPVDHFDKIAHFGYFFGGGGLLSAYLYFRKPAKISWPRLILTVVIFSAAIGAFDEWRQTFTLGRSGNDPWDWLADVLGGLAGALVFKAVHHRIK